MKPNDFSVLLQRFLHDPVDKPFDIPGHEKRAKEYADLLGIKLEGEENFSDQIASCMERSLLPPKIRQKFNEIRHPLSEEKINYKVSDNEIKIISSVYKKIAEELKKNAEKLEREELKYKYKFFFLWRNLQERLILESKNPYISLLPADTRIPDHSIWEHLKIASAINAFEKYQDNSLFLFTLGPVQQFIEQARKIQDLFAGSFILSYLTFIAIEKLIDKYGPTCIIYPDLYKQPFVDWYLEKTLNINVENSYSKSIDTPTIPNRFVAIIPNYDAEKIKEIAYELKKAIQDEWENIFNNIFKTLCEKIPAEAESQINDFPQIYWVSIPWKLNREDITISDFNAFLDEKKLKKFENLIEFAKNNGEHPPNIGILYEAIYSSLEKSIGARKNLRQFKQFSEAGRKCHLCGEKNVIVFSEKENKNKFQGFNPSPIDLTAKIELKYLSDGEGLCALCFTKRCFDKYLKEKFGEVFDDFTFPSTAEVACTNFKNNAIQYAKDEFENYIKLFKQITKDKFQKVNPLPKLKSTLKNIDNLEGEWFYEENLTEGAFKKYLDIQINSDKLEELKAKLKEITQRAGKPNPYYAILLLDADDMGKWFSGEKLPNIEHAYNSKVWGKQPNNTQAGNKIPSAYNSEVCENQLPSDFKEKLQKLCQKKILTPAIHSAISTALRNYSIEFVKKIVEEEHLGKLIYSGGDDILAFVNLKDLLDVMRKLRASFSGHIKITNGTIEVAWNNHTGCVEDDSRYLLTMGKNATASMGVVIAHYKMPLTIVLRKLREVEKKAKQTPDKDSFSIALLMRSGEEKIATFKWKHQDIDVIQTLIELTEYMTLGRKNTYISDHFIYKMNEEFQKIIKDGRFSLSEPIFNSEFKRNLLRSCHFPKENKKIEENELLKLYKKLVEIYWGAGNAGNFQNFINFLKIASFIAK